MFVASVVIPARNEEQDIEGCLRAVGAQDVGSDRLEVLVADGSSEDGTRARAEAVAKEIGFGRFAVLENAAGGISAGLNTGLAAATAPVLVRVDSRSRIEPRYVRTVVDVLRTRPEVGVVGGAQVPLDRGTGWVSGGIARALGNRYTTGLSRYRRANVSGAADTVWMGAFRAEELRALGGWDPTLAVNEDYELNERFRATGKLVWFEGDLRSGYLPRPTFGALSRQYFAFGRGKGARWASGARVAPRQLVLLAAPVLAAAAGVGVARRVGVVPTVAIAGAGLLAIDAIGGSDERAGIAVRAGAAAATVTFGASWWLGVLAGTADALFVEKGGTSA